MHTDNHCQNYQLFQKRRNARSTVVKSVYVHLQTGISLIGSSNDVRALSVKEMKIDESLVDSILQLLQKSIDSIVCAIQEQLHYDISRFTLIDKSILISALAEMRTFPFTEKSIIINEYIEITKSYSDLSSKSKINAILDALAQSEKEMLNSRNQVSEQYCDS